MKKLVLFLILISGFILTAQTSETHMGVFYSMPTGAFASTDYRVDGGYAEPGWGLIFDSWRNPENWGNLGFLIHSTYQWNNINTNKLAMDYSDVLGLNVEASESRYAPILATIGPSYTIGVTDNFEVGIGVAAGVLFNNTKDISLDMYNNSGDLLESYHVGFDNNVAFAMYGQAYANYTLVPDLFKIGIFADYAGAKQNTSLKVAGETSKSSQKISYMNFGVKFIIISSTR